jgi:23S rRNA (cytidine1920-2'-O)/16S rRNA (cytidine1409-2'-O)-methyltransferase
VRRGLAASRSEATALIGARLVLVSGSVADRPTRLVAPSEPVVVSGPAARFVGRGGEKLDAALDHFALPVDGIEVLDAGASTGGFTDCLLQRGAARVVAVDVGHGQLHARLRADHRVESHERTNIRHVSILDLGGRPFALVVADLSFISLRTVAPALTGLAAPGGDLVVLVKPQFEAGRREVSRGRGVIRDPGIWREALGGVASAMQSQGAAMMGAMVSPITGADGNVEFVAHLRTSGGCEPSARAPDLEAHLDAVVADAGRRPGTEG